jgi:rRNA processing protein Gar1
VRVGEEGEDVLGPAGQPLLAVQGVDPHLGEAYGALAILDQNRIKRLKRRADRPARKQRGHNRR